MVRAVVPRPKPDVSPRAFRPDIAIAFTFTKENVVGKVQFGLHDGLGNTVARVFEGSAGAVGLVGNDFRRLIMLAEQVQRADSFSNKIGTEYLIDLTML